MTEVEKRTQAHVEWLEKTLRDFEEWARSDQDLWYRTSLLREAYAGMLKEIRAHAAPDRALLIQAAATLAGGMIDDVRADFRSVKLARGIIYAVDRGDEEEL